MAVDPEEVQDRLLRVVGTALPGKLPLQTQEGGQQLFRLHRFPPAHATEKTPRQSPPSRVTPYAITSGMSSISPHQRTSSSCPMTMGIDSTGMISRLHCS